MKFRTITVFTLLLLMGVVLAFGACSSSSTSPTGTSKGLVFEIDEDGNSSHPDGWDDLHQATDPGEATFCAGCHASETGPELAPEPGCFNATLCHGADGDDSDSGDLDDSDSDDLDDSDSDDLDDSDSDDLDDSDEEEEVTL